MAELGISNAAGPGVKLLEDVKDVARSAVTAITVGSITIEQRDGNRGNTFWFDHASGATLNSLGLPNPGMEYYRKNLPTMAKIAWDSGKILRVNVVGVGHKKYALPEEYAILAEVAVEGGADQVELNFGCPNVWNNGEQKDIPSYDPNLICGIVLKTISRIAPCKLDLKLSPLYPSLIQRIAGVISSRHVRAVVTTNTFPNAMAFKDDGGPEIGFGNGLAGLGGSDMFHIGLGQAKQFRALLPPDIKVVAVGGINSGKRVRAYLKAGADDEVQIGSHFFQYGAKVFGEILQDYAERFC